LYTKTGTRAITLKQRRQDSADAIAWLSGRAEVDPTKIALIGWSNGGSSVLASTDQLSTAPNSDKLPVARAAIAFYPGCDYHLKKHYLHRTAV